MARDTRKRASCRAKSDSSGCSCCDKFSPCLDALFTPFSIPRKAFESARISCSLDVVKYRRLHCKSRCRRPRQWPYPESCDRSYPAETTGFQFFFQEAEPAAACGEGSAGSHLDVGAPTAPKLQVPLRTAIPREVSETGSRCTVLCQ